MVKWALYLDETGTPDPHIIPVPNGLTPAFTLAGVALPLDCWRDYDRSFLYLKREFFSKEINQSSKSDHAWEAKGTDLLSPRNASSARNAAFCHKVIDLIKVHGGKVVGVTFLKGVVKPMSKTSIYTKGFQIIAERFDAFLQLENATGICILDSRMAHTRKGAGADYKVAVSYLSFVFGNADGRKLRNLIEAPMFADSKVTAGLQIADIISGLVYTNAYREKLAPNGADGSSGFLDYRHTARFWDNLRPVVFEGPPDTDGRKLFGLRNIDHRDGPATSGQIAALAAKFVKQ